MTISNSALEARDAINARVAEYHHRLNPHPYIEEQIQAAIDKETAKLEDQKENLALLVRRLVRHSYTLGVTNKLTENAMFYINHIGAKCSPLRKLLRKIQDPK